MLAALRCGQADSQLLVQLVRLLPLGRKQPLRALLQRAAGLESEPRQLVLQP